MSQFARLEREHQQMSADVPESIKALTDDVLYRYLFGCSDRRLQVRLLEAQSIYLRRSSGEVRQSDVSAALNRFALTLAIPKYEPVTEEMVAAVRALWIRLTPLLLENRACGQKGAPNCLSPVGATFLGLGILLQKYNNPLFKASAGEFVRSVKQILPADRPEISFGIGGLPPADSAEGRSLEQLQRVAARINDSSSDANKAAMRFFDDLFSR